MVADAVSGINGDACLLPSQNRFTTTVVKNIETTHRSESEPSFWSCINVESCFLVHVVVSLCIVERFHLWVRCFTSNKMVFMFLPGSHLVLHIIGLFSATYTRCERSDGNTRLITRWFSKKLQQWPKKQIRRDPFKPNQSWFCESAAFNRKKLLVA